MSRYFKLSICLMVITLATCVTVLAQERKIKREQLPPAVEKTVAAETQGETINGFTTEDESGKLVAHEARLQTGAKRTEIRFGPNGEKLAHPE